MFNLHPIDVSNEQLKALNDQEDFNPADLDHCSKRNKSLEFSIRS